MIFIDTGAFYARHVPGDRLHARATRVWSRLAKSSQRLFTSNFVLDELCTLAARRVHHGFAVHCLRGIMDSQRLTILRPEHEDELEALVLFEKFADQGVSFTDALSFALMRKLRLRRAFAFDRHFALAGFDLLTR